MASGAFVVPSPTRRFGSPSDYTPKYLADQILTSRTALEGERKQVTVLFADLQGSMQLMAERDPEEARRILDPILELMMEAVHWYEGTVNQVMGDGIMALFGAPLAQEDHALRGCYAALRMQEAVRRDARERVAVNVRIGLNSGEVVVRTIGSDLRMDYSAIGQTTHIAGRMEQLAAPGTTLMAQATAALVEGYVRVRSLGRREIKGLVNPLELFELLGAEGVRSRLKARGERLTKFVGRAEELDRLAATLEPVRGGHGQVVAVVSEAGVGKSRLYAEFLRSPHTRDCLLLETGCVSYRKASYLPVVELLRAYFQVAENDAPFKIREKVVGKLASRDAPLDAFVPPCLWMLDVPVDDARWDRLDPEQRRRRAMEAVQRLLLHESRVQPVIIVFEDLHWIDAESQAFLDSLVVSLPAARLLLLVNYRPEYQHDWAGRSYYRLLRIDGLSRETADELTEALLGPDPSLAPLKRLLVARTEGNPFFIEEIVRTLREMNALEGPRGAHRLAGAVGELRVPATVQAVLAARIDRLPDELKRLLQHAAVIGLDVPFTVLREVSDLDSAQLRGALARLQSDEFLYETRLFPDLEYTFRHALTHDVAYGSVVTDRRRTLHARIAEAIERLQAGRLAEVVESLAHHWSRAEVWSKAVGYLRQAGERAVGMSATREAAEWFTQALDALDRMPMDFDTLRLAVDIRLDLRAALYAVGEFEPMVARLREADELAGKLDDPRRIAWISIYMGEHWRQTGEFARAIASIERALGVGETVGDPAVRLAAHQYLGLACYAVGDYRRAATLMRTVAQLPLDDPGAAQFRPTQAGSPAGFRAVSLGWLARCLADLGDFDEGRAHGHEAVRIGERIDHPYSLASACWGLGYLHVAEGDFGAAELVLQRALKTARDASVMRLLPQVMRELGLAYARLGRPGEGIPVLEDALRIVEAIGLVVGYSSTLSHLGEAYVIAGRVDEAAAVVDRAYAIAHEHGQQADKAAALRLLGAIAFRRGDRSDARRHYGASIALAESLGMRPFAARGRLDLGTVLRLDGEPAARPTLEEARAAFGELGMSFWRDAAQAELDALR
ncbi:MAG TPA: tetratricopeptide repeat protein [Methylomirabilota bacterium]|nr:tetratricopeptide repeat protein [Methylomirabilota bacterium]